MKKLLVFVSMVLLTSILAACGSQSTQTKGEILKDDLTEQLPDTESFDLIGLYKNKDTSKDGFVTVDYEGFLLKLSPKIVDVTSFGDEKVSGLAIKVDVQAENTRDGQVDYSGDMEIITDTKKQLIPVPGLMSNNPVIQKYKGEEKGEGYLLAFLKDNKHLPKKITLILKAPYEVMDGKVDPENGILGEGDKQIDFILDEK